tara:strand:+ start:99 stop:668 length:570 start_codon:yes stop_codon:yes gene_type:complete
MLKRFSILALVLSFTFAGPFDMKGKTAKNKFNTLPGGKGKKEKPYNKKDSDLTYEKVAIEVKDAKTKYGKSKLTKLEKQAIEAFLDGKVKSGSYLKHLSNAMKKHDCYVKNSNRRVEKMKKFNKWPSLGDKVSWFALDCKSSKTKDKIIGKGKGKTDGSSPINPKKYRKGANRFNAGGNSKKDGANNPQ